MIYRTSLLAVCTCDQRLGITQNTGILSVVAIVKVGERNGTRMIHSRLKTVLKQNAVENLARAAENIYYNKKFVEHHLILTLLLLCHIKSSSKHISEDKKKIMTKNSSINIHQLQLKAQNTSLFLGN